MKVVIATSRPFHLVHLSRELAEIGHEVTTFGYMPEFRIQHYRPGKAKYKSLFLHLLPYSALALQARLRYAQKLSTERLFKGVDEYVASNMPECDVFIGLSGVISKSFCIAKKKYGAITICDRGSSHVKTQMSILKDRDTARLSENYVQRELEGYASADYVAVPSVYAEMTFQEQGFDMRRLFINNYGVDLSRFNPDKSPKSGGAKRLLFVGSWTYQKGVDIFSEALDADPMLELTHIGMPGDVAFPVNPRFKTLGPLPNNLLAEHYRSHDVFVLPSRQDGFGMVLLEAMACGTPIVASFNTGAPDIKSVVGDSGSVALMHDVSAESLIAAVNEIADKSNSRTSAVISSSEQEYFTWKNYGRRYSEFLNRVAMGLKLN